MLYDVVSNGLTSATANKQFRDYDNETYILAQMGIFAHILSFCPSFLRTHVKALQSSFL